MMRRLACVVGAVVFALSGAVAVAQTFPAKPIRFIVPYPPGGIADLQARIVQPKLQAALGQPIIVENRTGAGGNIGTDHVAKAAPDGYTILFSASGPLAINKSLYKSLPFDPERDLRGVVQLAAFPMVLVVNADVPAKDAAEFIDWVKSSAQPQPYGSAGSGTPQHLVAELFAKMIGAKLEHIPFKGSGPALNSVMARQIPFMFEHIGGVMHHVHSGRMRALAVTSAVRSAALPDVPTLAESGLKGFDFTAWNGVSVPRETPDAVVETLNKAFRQALNDPEVRARWAEQGSLSVAGSGAQFDSLVKAESERLGRLVRETGATAD